MTDKNILITAITEYSNEIDNIYIENLFEVLGIKKLFSEFEFNWTIDEYHRLAKTLK